LRKTLISNILWSVLFRVSEEGAGAGSGEIGASKMLALTRKGVLSPDRPGDEVQRSRHRGVVPDATFLWDGAREG
jgi:hypothetical protein